MLDTVFPKYVNNKQTTSRINVAYSAYHLKSLSGDTLSLLGSTNIPKQTISDKAKMNCQESRKRHNCTGLEGEEEEPEWRAEILFHSIKNVGAGCFPLIRCAVVLLKNSPPLPLV